MVNPRPSVAELAGIRTVNGAAGAVPRKNDRHFAGSFGAGELPVPVPAVRAMGNVKGYRRLGCRSHKPIQVPAGGSPDAATFPLRRADRQFSALPMDCQYQAVPTVGSHTGGVSGAGELGRALRAWRDRTAPAAVGVPAGGLRRAAGLRREELAQLAGLSVDYIIRLEQGRATTPSAQVLSALARALRLSEDEREYLYLLAGQPVPGPGKVPAHISPSVRRLLDQLDGTPLIVCDASWNLLLWNPLWSALFGDASVWRGRERNVAWRHFTGCPSRVRYTAEQESHFMRGIVGDLRAAAARYPADTDLRSLIKDLLAVSTDFVRLWETGVVGIHTSHVKTFQHPDVGTLTLDCDILTVPGHDLRIVTFTAPPGSTSADRLKLLNVIGIQSMSDDNSLT